jgi:hypothetical protein
MASNPYAKAPLCVAQVDPLSGKHLRAFFFLGAVPRAVLDAARRGRPTRGDPRAVEWAATDGATLRSYYGQHWRDLLTAQDPPEARGLAGATWWHRPVLAFRLGGARPASRLGGARPPLRTPAQVAADTADLDFGDLGDLEDLDKEAPGGPAPAGEEPESAGAFEWSGAAAAPPVYTDLAVYPEDTLYELRLKLGLAAGVPLYRQHLFYYVNGEGPLHPYRLTVDGAPVVVDWRALAVRGAAGSLQAGPRAAAEAVTALARVPVDRHLEERREGLQVEALDTFTALGPSPGVRVTAAYYVDLYAVVPPLGAAERPQDGLAAVLHDRYQFDLLYYGGLLRYWPQLSPDACSLALADPARVRATYPALDPGPEALRARFAAEQAVADAALGWRPTAAKGGRAAEAVTAATVRVVPEAGRMRADIRNIFDWVPASPAVAAIMARFEVDPALLSEAGAALAGPEHLRGGLVVASAVKRHASSYGPASAAAIDYFVEHAPRRGAAAFALARRGEAAGARVPYARLVVYADGEYETSADWREDDRVGFAQVAAEMAAVAAPTVAAINAMGAAAFPIGGCLRVPTKAPAGRLHEAESEESGIPVGGRPEGVAPGIPVGGRPEGAAPGGTTLGAITVSAFWPHALTAAAFRELKTRFRAYEKAGVVGVRGLQQAGAYAFSFRKGVVAYDPRLAERAAATPGASRGTNQYAWLSEPGAAARWAAAFQGRLVRFYHRTSDLRVEVTAADSLAEFELIRRYLFSFLDGLLAGPGRLRVGDVEAEARALTPEEARAASRRLRLLQERDPNLFDLKKYDPRATSYSILCQAGRQPRVFSEAEAAALPARQRAALVRYWNFTEGAPAFYDCPSPHFPHLSFRAEQHPLGYCLPCCKKTRPAAGSRAALVNEACLARRAASDVALEGTLSRHVLTYGKEVPPGRVADPPRELGAGLLLDAVPPPFGPYLVGVEQATPAVPHAGYAYALAYAASVGDAPADEVLSELAALAGQLGDTYTALGGGGAAAFASAGELADAILGAFVRRDAALSPFGPGGAAAAAWPAILSELARHAYGVETVVAADPEGSGAVTLEAAHGAADALLGRGVCAGYVRPRVALLVSGPAGTYPLALLNPKFYLRAAHEHRWMAARRSFGEDAHVPIGEEGGAGAELIIDRVAASVCEALAAAVEAAPSLPDLAVLARYSCAPSAFVIDLRLVDMHNLCYGALLRRREAGIGLGQPACYAGHTVQAVCTACGESGPAPPLVYFPVRRSAYPVDGTPTLYGVRPAVPLPHVLLQAAIADFNAFLASAGETCPPIAPVAPLVGADGRCIGFVHAPTGEALYFFHDPEGEAPAGAPVRLPYDPREVDLAIHGRVEAGAPAHERLAPAHERLAREAGARNRLYRLFLAEFAAALRGDRNKALRAELAAAIRGANFASPDSVGALRRRLTESLQAYPADLQVFRAIIARAYAAAPQDPAGAVLAALAATAFDFDRQELARLRALGTHLEVVAALRALLAPRVVEVEAPEQGAGNLYVACADAPREAGPAGAPGLGAQCVGGKLAVPARRLADFYDLLAADVRNPGKVGLLAAASAGVFEPLEFIRRPGEHLQVVLGV